MRCLHCDSDKLEDVEKKGWFALFANKDKDIFRCKDCGMLFIGTDHEERNLVHFKPSK